MNLPNVLVNLTSNYWVTRYFVLKPWTIWCIFNLRSLVSVFAVAHRQWRGSFKHLDDLLMSDIKPLNYLYDKSLMWTKDWVQSSATHFSICILHFFYCLSFKKQPKIFTGRPRYLRSNILCKFCFVSWQSVIYLRIFTSLWDRHEHYLESVV